LQIKSPVYGIFTSAFGQSVSLALNMPLIEPVNKFMIVAIEKLYRN